MSDITLRGYNYRQKTNRGLTHHVNSQKTRQFNIVWTGLTHHVNSQKTRQNNIVWTTRQFNIVWTTRQFNLVWTGLTNWMDCIYVLEKQIHLKIES